MATDARRTTSQNQGNLCQQKSTQTKSQPLFAEFSYFEDVDTQNRGPDDEARCALIRDAKICTAILHFTR